MCKRFELKTNSSHELLLAYDFKLILQENKMITINSNAYYISKDFSPQLNQAKFGLNIFDKVIYNARSETLLEKNIFREDYISHKGVFPCTSFYEFDDNKDEHRFDLLKEEMGYLAGFIVNDSFILITRSSYPDLDMFKRLPVVLSKDEVDTYLESKDNVKLLNKFNTIKFHISGISDQIKLF